MKTGLVLEGGAMRGLFTAGVLDVLMEQGIRLDGAVGVSAGAAFGCNYKSGQIGRAVRYNVCFARDWRFCSVRSLLLTGDLFGAKFCYETVPMELDKFDYDAYRRDPMPFYAVCTDMETGKAVYTNVPDCSGAQMDWIRASASLPLVSRPVVIGGRAYLDGGIADAIPLAFMEKQGYARNLVILTQPEGYRKKPAHPLIRTALRKHPQLAETMMQRHEMYNRETAYVFAQAAAKKAFVICPPQPIGISRTERDPEKLRAVYALGRRTATEQLDALRAFLQEGADASL